MIEDKLSKFLFQKRVYQTGGPFHESGPRSGSLFQKGWWPLVWGFFHSPKWFSAKGTVPPCQPRYVSGLLAQRKTNVFEKPCVPQWAWPSTPVWQRFDEEINKGKILSG